MARRLLGPDNANYTFDQDSLSDSQPDQVRQRASAFSQQDQNPPAQGRSDVFSYRVKRTRY